MAYPYYQNSQIQMQELQSMRDRIDNQMRSIQQNQIQQPQVPQVTQNFQLAPSTTNNDLEVKYANNIEEVKNTFVMKTGVFLTKDFKTLWIKNINGDIKTFKTEEIIELDAKDREILDLQRQVNELKGMIENATKHDNTDIVKPVENKKSTRVSTNKSSNAK